MTWPPQYPRVPHLPPAPEATRDDLVLDRRATSALLAERVVVEEKLDGANVMLWLDRDAVKAATRGGPGARDRGAQLGPLRAWAAGRIDTLRPLLADRRVLYGEWMWLTHSIAYDALPDSFIGLDLLSPETGFATLATRDQALDSAGLVSPPRLFTGVLGTRERLDELLATSRYGGHRAEGLIIRPTAPGSRVRVAKVVGERFERRSDESWRRDRQRNALAR